MKQKTEEDSIIYQFRKINQAAKEFGNALGRLANCDYQKIKKFISTIRKSIK